MSGAVCSCYGAGVCEQCHNRQIADAVEREDRDSRARMPDRERPRLEARDLHESACRLAWYVAKMNQGKGFEAWLELAKLIVLMTQFEQQHGDIACGSRLPTLERVREMLGDLVVK